MVRQKTHDELKAKYAALVEKYDKCAVDYAKLVKRWNGLVDEINAKGGIAALGQQVSQSEIRMMIKLCHPDKHNNSADATLMTQTLLKMRK